MWQLGGACATTSLGWQQWLNHQPLLVGESMAQLACRHFAVRSKIVTVGDP
jgi:Fe-S cluster biosynthesis and repair protein YggX